MITRSLTLDSQGLDSSYEDTANHMLQMLILGIKGKCNRAVDLQCSMTAIKNKNEMNRNLQKPTGFEFSVQLMNETISLICLMCSAIFVSTDVRL